MIFNLRKIIPFPCTNDSLLSDFANNTKKCLVYPTDDLLLYKDQFSHLFNLLNKDEQIYVMLFEEWDQLYNNHNCVFHISSFEEYSSVYDLNEKMIFDYRNGENSDFNIYYFCSKSIVFSDSYDWILQITESEEGGIGILGGEATRIDAFKKSYKRYEEDLTSYIDFYTNKRQNCEDLVSNTIKFLI